MRGCFARVGTAVALSRLSSLGSPFAARDQFHFFQSQNTHETLQLKKLVNIGVGYQLLVNLDRIKPEFFSCVNLKQENIHDFYHFFTYQDQIRVPHA